MRLDNDCCLNCEERHEKCHSTCEKYLAAKRRHAEVKKEMLKEVLVNQYAAEVNKRKRKRFMK